MDFVEKYQNDDIIKAKIVADEIDGEFSVK